MKINSQTRISVILRHNPDAVEAIASINPHFRKLRNPVLRKILAPRVTVADAARIGKCTPADILEKLRAIGFEVEEVNAAGITGQTPGTASQIEAVIQSGRLEVMDVRPILERGNDPFQMIMSRLRDLPPGYALEVINSFEPVPLINILAKKGYISLVKTSEEAIHTFFLKTATTRETRNEDEYPVYMTAAELDREKLRFSGHLHSLDARDLEMPLPMMKILEELETLPPQDALFVQHKKVPQYLLPELMERQYKTLIADIEEGNVQLLIFR